MGVVFSSLWHWMFPDKEYKIVMVRRASERERHRENKDKDMSDVDGEKKKNIDKVMGVSLFFPVQPFFCSCLFFLLH